VVITPSTDRDWVEVVRHLEKRGLRMIVVLIAPDSFGGGEGAQAVVAELAAGGTPTYLVRKGDDLAAALSWRAWGVLERPGYVARR